MGQILNFNLYSTLILKTYNNSVFLQMQCESTIQGTGNPHTCLIDFYPRIQSQS